MHLTINYAPTQAYIFDTDEMRRDETRRDEHIYLEESISQLLEKTQCFIYYTYIYINECVMGPDLMKYSLYAGSFMIDRVILIKP